MSRLRAVLFLESDVSERKDEEFAVVIDDETDADFEAGFNSEEDPFKAPVLKKETPAEAPATEVDATVPPEEWPMETPAETGQVDETPEPQPADELHEMREKVARLEAAINDSAHATKSDLGRVQAHLQKLVQLQEVQRAQPQGSPAAEGARKLEAAMFKELSEDYPDVAERLLPGLNRMVDAASAAPKLDPNAIKQIVTEAIEAAKPTIIGEASNRAVVDAAFAAISEEHGDWESIVGSKGSDGQIVHNAEGQLVPNPEFRAWFSAKPAEFQQKFGASKSPVFVSRAIAEFKEHVAKKSAASTSRQDRLQKGITPSGKPAAGKPTQLTPEQEFLAGYADG